LEGGGVDEVDGVAYAMAEGDLGDLGERGGHAFGKADEVVFANRSDFDGEGRLVVGGRVLDVQRDELFGALYSVRAPLARRPGGESVQRRTSPGRRR
jgi:hypothetical protein